MKIFTSIPSCIFDSTNEWLERKFKQLINLHTKKFNEARNCLNQWKESL